MKDFAQALVFAGTCLGASIVLLALIGALWLGTI